MVSLAILPSSTKARTGLVNLQVSAMTFGPAQLLYGRRSCPTVTVASAVAVLPP